VLLRSNIQKNVAKKAIKLTLFTGSYRAQVKGKRVINEMPPNNQQPTTQLSVKERRRQ